MEKESRWFFKRNPRKPRKHRVVETLAMSSQGLLCSHCLPCKKTGLLLLGFVVIVLNGEMNMRISVQAQGLEKWRTSVSPALGSS